MEIIDITQAVSSKTVKWPDDTDPPSQKFLTHTDRGDPNTVSEWKMSSHTGTHVDARMHFIPDGWGMDDLTLTRSVGACRVVDLGHVQPYWAWCAWGAAKTVHSAFTFAQIQDPPEVRP